MDASEENPKKVFQNINTELELFSNEIKNKPQIIVFNKIDLDEIQVLQDDIVENMKSITNEIYFISYSITFNFLTYIKININVSYFFKDRA